MQYIPYSVVLYVHYCTQYPKMLECRNIAVETSCVDVASIRHVVHSVSRVPGQCSLQHRFRSRTPHISQLLVPVNGHGPSRTTSPSGCPSLLFPFSSYLVCPQSLLSLHPQATGGNKKQSSSPPCTDYCISRARFVHFRCTGSIPEVYRTSNSLLSSSRHSTSFGI